MAKKLTIFGALGVLAYVIHVVLGGFLWEGYSHLHQPISDLTARGAPNRGLLSSITFLYGVFSILFAASAYIVIKRFAPKISRIGMLLFLVMQVISITYGLFPQDLPGAPMTFTGLMHLVITALIVPLTILAPLLVGIGFRKIRSFQSYGNYSIATGGIILIAGGSAAFFFANQWPYFGLVERINIGVLQLWMLVTSIRLFTMKEPSI
ncbi:hypothetical protein BB776_04550 [Planococcus salinarum]|uniref:DUF998 domain-containing protein n=1 Tax=Planococcus salinarum TaxID=622695 RepID=A0ABX3CTZ0_9BACL|nr:DUF998 domain-containing protein [Planococcus salinarum]OHX48956.1 hypothetical protein BB776_04550 [Planococcus salinarum]TAA73097.1 DUF998 domain-containing protein [Planococcus salinarum]